MNRSATATHLAPFILGLACLMPIGSVHAADPAELDDPHLWLEEVTGDAALAWVREQNAESTAELAGTDAFKALDERLLEDPRLQREDPVRLQGRRRTTTTSGATRRTSAACGGGRRSRSTARPSRSGKPSSTSTRSAEAEKENWVWNGRELPAADVRALPDLALARRGRRRRGPRVRRHDARRSSKDGFTLPEAKSDVAWRGPDSVFVGTDFGPGSLTDSGYPRIVKEWRRGTPLADGHARLRRASPTTCAVSALSRPDARASSATSSRGAITFYTSETVPAAATAS